MRSRLVLSERGIEVVAQFTCPMRHITQTYNFLIDTGSSSSYLGWEDAAKAGIKVEELPSSSKPIFGFGGAADVKHLKEPCSSTSVSRVTRWKPSSFLMESSCTGRRAGRRPTGGRDHQSAFWEETFFGCRAGN